MSKLSFSNMSLSLVQVRSCRNAVCSILGKQLLWHAGIHPLCLFHLHVYPINSHTVLLHPDLSRIRERLRQVKRQLVHIEVLKLIRVILFWGWMCIILYVCSKDDLSSVTPLLVMLYLFCYAPFTASEVRKVKKLLISFIFYFSYLTVYLLQEFSLFFFC